MPEAEPAAASVLDASALMAHLNGEAGAAAVRDAMGAGAAISVVNLAEVLSKAAEIGHDPERLVADLREAVAIEPLNEADCIEVARLRPTTRALGLSLADRACLALASRLAVPVLTADRSWSQIESGNEVQLIR